LFKGKNGPSFIKVKKGGDLNILNKNEPLPEKNYLIRSIEKFYKKII